MNFITKIIILFSLLSTLFNNGQNPSRINIKKELKDTINYSSFSDGLSNQYVLKKVRQFNGQEIFDMKGYQLFFVICKDTATFKGPDFIVKPIIGDTAMTISWDSETKDVHNTMRHLVATIKINQKTNIIIATKNIYNHKLKTYNKKIKMFRIVKWTFSEIILKDISKPDFKRTYYFRKQSPS
jgi:hypothetical protein